MMDLLHIDALRSGPQPDPSLPNAANFDESKVNQNLQIPDPLTLKNGRKVTAAKMWWEKRRPEIVEDFDREVYGRVPENTPGVRWEVVSKVREKNGDTPVITKTLVGHVDNSSYPLIQVDIQLTFSTPASASGPVPVIMELEYGDKDWEAITETHFPGHPEALANAMDEPIGGKMPDHPTWEHQVLAKGWGYATFNCTSVQADDGAGLTVGIIGLMNKGQPRDRPDEWGALRAWAWGASRVMDYFETDKSVDAKRIGLAGHSRFGKAALVTMAYDQRFAIAFVSSSGEGGAEQYRRNFGEQVEDVAAANEYHWMAGNFLKYAGPLTPNDLPVDSDELIALCAPRPVFIGGGATQGDGWVDAKGMFLAAVGAGPVYRLLGEKDLGTVAFPPTGTALMDGDIAFRQHSYGHVTWPNWPFFLIFADRHFGMPRHE